MAGTLPLGKGLYIWQSNKIDPAVLASEVRELGLGHVVFKVADGQNRYPFGTEQAKLLECIDAVRALGNVQIWGYQYTYANNSLEEADTFAGQLSSLRLVGGIIDAEGEYRPYNQTPARIYSERLRLKMGVGYPIGLSSYRWPMTMQPDFPWQTFYPNIDFVYPQVYCLYADNWVDQLARSVSEYTALYGAMPYVPVGCAYPAGTWKPLPAHLQLFMEAAKARGFAGVSFWKYESLRAYTELYATVRDFNWPLPVPPPPDPEPEPQVDWEHVRTELGGIVDSMAAVTERVDDLYSYLFDGPLPPPDPPPDPEPEPEPEDKCIIVRVRIDETNDRAKTWTWKKKNEADPPRPIGIEALDSQGNRLVFKDATQNIYCEDKPAELWDGGWKMYRLAPVHTLPDGSIPPNGLYVNKEDVIKIA